MTPQSANLSAPTASVLCMEAERQVALVIKGHVLERQQLLVVVGTQAGLVPADFVHICFGPLLKAGSCIGGLGRIRHIHMLIYWLTQADHRQSVTLQKGIANSNDTYVWQWNMS